MSPDRAELARQIALALAAGRVEAPRALQALRGLAGEEEAPSRAALLAALEAAGLPELEDLRRHVETLRVRDCQRHHELRRAAQPVPSALAADLADLPTPRLGWEDRESVAPRLRGALLLLRDRLFLVPRREAAPQAAAALDAAYQAALDRLAEEPAFWESLALRDLVAASRQLLAPGPELEAALGRAEEAVRRHEEGRRKAMARALDSQAASADDLDEPAELELVAARFRARADPDERRRLLDLTLTSPGEQAIPHLLAMCAEPWAQQRAALVLTLRFGTTYGLDWDAWRRWLENHAALAERNQPASEADAPALLLLWYGSQEGADPVALGLLEQACRTAAGITIEGFVDRWQGSLTLAERRALLEGRAVETPAPPEPAASRPVALPEARPARPPEPRPAPPPGPSLWRDHVAGFFAENWYMVAGVLMVLLGASLLAYFTWDRHWALRYTIMPVLLGGFTFALAELGGWVERRDAAFRDTAATLRGLAIALLPVNFMAVALLAGDPQVTWKAIAVPLMALAYAAVFGRGLQRWCRAVHPSLGPLALALLGLDALVLLRPLARWLTEAEGGLSVLAVGFHVGFVVLAVTVLRFARDVLDRELVGERRVPWFVGAALVITYLEVFAWVHGSLGRFPPPSSYALLVIVTGGLVLAVEARFLELRAEAGPQAAESFLGYAFVILGLLMGSGEPHVRVLAFAVAGLIWLRQAVPRPDPLQYWVGLTLLTLSGASLGLLPGFPGARLGTLGVALALGVRGIGRLAPRAGGGVLLATCRELQLAVALLAAGVSVLAQWHHRSWPLGTALELLALAAIFAWRARRDQSLRWVHTAMVLLALTLPYLGFADVLGRTLHGNTLVFGLALLGLGWIALLAARPAPLLIAARSTVLVLYGAFALGAMLLRVVVEGGAGVEHSFMDWSGPLLITIALLVATWHARSLVPAWMAAAIVVVLFPQLKVAFQASFPGLQWGTGHGSAWSALALVCACFWLRDLPALVGLQGGDLLLGSEPFPLRRTDHRLFTTPLLASALFLIVKTDTWTLLRHLGHQIPLKTGVALLVTGVAWTLVAAYSRERPAAALAVHLGWIALLAGCIVVHRRLVEEPHLQWPLLATGLVLQSAEIFYRRWLPQGRPWIAGLLADPTRGVLRIGGLLLSIGCVLGLLAGTPLRDVGPLASFLALELARHGLERRSRIEGAQLFVMAYSVLLAVVLPGDGPLLGRYSIEQGVTPTLALIASLQLVLLALEWLPALHERLGPLLVPAQASVTLLGAGLAFVGLVDALAAPDLAIRQQLLLLLALLLLARAHRCGPLALAAAGMAYVCAQAPALRTGGSNLPLLLSPWRLVAFAVALALLARLGRSLGARRPRLLAGPFGFAGLGGPVAPWLEAPAIGLALLATLRHSAGHLRHDRLQLVTPYLAAFTHVLVGWSAGSFLLFPLAAGLVSLGNIHAVRLFLGETLREGGLSEVHLVALGLALSLLQCTLLRLAVPRAGVVSFVNRTSLVLATLVLTLLAANYLGHPDLDRIAPLRFVISGAMALAAGLYFRRAARQPGAGEEALVEICEGLYHFGVAMAVWCAALLLPWLRQPSTALLALALPALYFWARAELGAEQLAERYRDSAAVLGCVLLALYTFRPAFQMVLFPETPIRTEHYHLNAAFVLGLGLLLMRLHRLGASEWLALYGGLALIAGSYFGLTAWPGLSPFGAPLLAAWCAVGLAHFWTLASDQGSPLRSALQELAGLDGEAWLRLRNVWGRCVLVASQVVALLGLVDAGTESLAIAPLLLGAASVIVHHGVVRHPGLESKAYLLLARVQVLIALHADFLVSSYLPRDQVVWVLLGLWALLLLLAEALPERLTPARIAPSVGLFAGLALGHALWHHASSTTGLWAVGLGALLLAATPRQSAEAGDPEEHAAAVLLLGVPAWLVYFSQAPLLEEGVAGALHTWPVLATLAAIFLTGLALRSYQPVWQARVPVPARPRLGHQVLALAGRQGAAIHAGTLTLSFLAACGLQLAHYGSAFASGDLLLLGLLQGAFVWAWYEEGQRRQDMAPYLCSEIALLAGFSLLRRQLLLTTTFWTHEHDVWASLGASLLLTGAKDELDRRPRELRSPLIGTILLLPALAVLWTIVHGLGSDVALIVVGLNSLMFAYLGRERRDSPYNLVATSGFVAFVLIVFWSKLGLRTLHAYTIPVGLGVLALLQMFGRNLPPDTRNRIRLFTLLGMLGSAGYYALVDDRHPLAFNLTLLLLCLAAMGLGSWLRVRLHVVLGFAGIVVDLISIAVKVLGHLDRGARMTSVGALVLLLGVALVGGALYVKTERERLETWLARIRNRLVAWE